MQATEQITATIQEDGSTMVLTKCNDIWTLSTNDKIFDHTKLICIFNDLIGTEINEFAYEMLLNFSDLEINTITKFSFEMCSQSNRIIKFYKTPVLYLFGVFAEDKEISFEDVELPSNVKRYTKIISDGHLEDEEILDKILESTKSNLQFKGVVIKTQNDTKIINHPYYTIKCTLKYGGWSKCTPEMIVPLILDDMDHEIISDVIKSVKNDHIFTHELNTRIEFYKGRIEHEYNCIVITINDLISKDFESKDKYADYLKEVYPNIYSTWDKFFLSIFKEIKFIKRKKSLPLNTAFKIHFLSNINKIFLHDDYFISLGHAKEYCKLNITGSNVTKDLDDYKNDGVSNTKNICYCGSVMKTSKLEYTQTRYKFCACGKVIGYTNYLAGSYLSMCCDKECLCTHEVDQVTLEQLGLPCCMLCNSLRTQIKILGNEINTSVHSLGISECICILKYMA